MNCEHCFFYAGEDDLLPGCILVDPSLEYCAFGIDFNLKSYEQDI